MQETAEGQDPAQNNPFDGLAPDPNVLQQRIAALQAQHSQLQRMMNESNIPAQSRMNAQVQAAQLTTQIASAQEMLQLSNQIMNVAAAAAAADANGRNFQGKDRNWQNTYQAAQPASADSAYQRLPVNPRRRLQKRAADWDADGRDPKVPRYWE